MAGTRIVVTGKGQLVNNLARPGPRALRLSSWWPPCLCSGPCSWRVRCSAGGGPAASALPVSIGIGILKYHPYDIDRIVSRTLAYAIVTGAC